MKNTLDVKCAIALALSLPLPPSNPQKDKGVSHKNAGATNRMCLRDINYILCAAYVCKAKMQIYGVALLKLLAFTTHTHTHKRTMLFIHIFFSIKCKLCYNFKLAQVKLLNMFASTHSHTLFNNSRTQFVMLDRNRDELGFIHMPALCPAVTTAVKKRKTVTTKKEMKQIHSMVVKPIDNDRHKYRHRPLDCLQSVPI